MLGLIVHWLITVFMVNGFYQHLEVASPFEVSQFWLHALVCCIIGSLLSLFLNVQSTKLYSRKMYKLIV
jgi:hypothetical protein